jgi:hypothetical protein
MHSGVCGAHQHWKATALKILRTWYYWPTLFSDVFTIVRACSECQNFVGKHKLLSLPLKRITTNGPFQQWGLDFIGEINPPSNGQLLHIIFVTLMIVNDVNLYPLTLEGSMALIPEEE